MAHLLVHHKVEDYKKWKPIILLPFAQNDNP